MKHFMAFLMGAVTATALLVSLNPPARAAENDANANPNGKPARVMPPGMRLVSDFLTVAPTSSAYSKTRGDQIRLLGDTMEVTNKSGTFYIPLSNVASYRLEAAGGE